MLGMGLALLAITSFKKNQEIKMFKKEERFEVIYKDGSELKSEGVRQILVDRETGVNYLCWKSGYGAGITPLLDSDGSVVITEYFDTED